MLRFLCAFQPALPLRRLSLALLSVFPLIASAASSYEFHKGLPKLVVTSSAGSSNAGVAPTAPTTYSADTSSHLLTFDPTVVGQNQTIAVTLTNTGTGTLTLTSPATSGDGAFSAATDCGTALVAQASCRANVTFAPTVRGPVSGTLTFGSNATAGNITVSLSGTGTAGIATLKANTSSDFGAATVGTTVSRSFTLTNTGDAPLNNVYPSVSGQGVTVSSSSCGTQALPTSVAPNSLCVTTVSYTPTSSGTLLGAQLTLATSVGAQSMALSGSSTWDFSSLMNGFTTPASPTSRFYVWNATMGNTWYWNITTASSTAPAGTVEFRQEIDVAGTADVSANLRGSVDNSLSGFAVNGVAISLSGYNYAYNTVVVGPAFTLHPGKNVVAVQVTNAVAGNPNPAGFALEVRDSQNVLLAPISGWFRQ